MIDADPVLGWAFRFASGAAFTCGAVMATTMTWWIVVAVGLCYAGFSLHMAFSTARGQKETTR